MLNPCLYLPLQIFSRLDTILTALTSRSISALYVAEPGKPHRVHPKRHISHLSCATHQLRVGFFSFVTFRGTTPVQLLKILIHCVILQIGIQPYVFAKLKYLISIQTEIQSQHDLSCLSSWDITMTWKKFHWSTKLIDSLIDWLIVWLVLCTNLKSFEFIRWEPENLGKLKKGLNNCRYARHIHGRHVVPITSSTVYGHRRQH